jgi:lipopolysaccharide biosynthesis protein
MIPQKKTLFSALYFWFVSGILRRKKIKPDALVSRIIEPSDYARQYSSPDSHPEFEKEQLCYSGEINPKLIAFYLPQFHPFEENDRFWGKGFTEWTNVTKALPVYKGHHQPKLPGELGFYDLRLKPVMERQIELAKRSGIFGFCFHHYFLESKPVMRKPFDLFFHNPDLDFPFCLHWANEPWTVRWDGNRNRDGILIDQVHDDEENMAFIKDIAPILRDKRYICIEKRPVLLIYRPALFPDFKRTAGMWKEFCRKNGIEEPYLVMTKTLFDANKTPEHYGMDAAVEFPPHLVPRISLIDDVTLHHPDFTGSVNSYQAVMDDSINLQKPPYTLFRGIMPQWDNTARNRSATIYHGSNPFLYQKWMTALGKYTLENLPADRQFIFINAWNEWAEGAYLEPDRKHGYAWLNATTKAMQTLHHE